MQQTAVKFLTKTGHFFAAAMPEAEARALIKNWASKEYKLRDRPRIVGADGAWAIDLDDVQFLHLDALQVVQQPQQQLQPYGQPPGNYSPPGLGGPFGNLPPMSGGM